MKKVSGPIGQRIAADRGYAPDRVLGVVDIARRFGVTRQRVGQIARQDPTFPAPGFHDVYGGSAWLAAGIECWAAAHRPTADTGGFGPDMAALLRHGEAVAARIGHRYVESAHVWHAIASGVAGPGPRQALVSMGLDPGLIDEALLVIDPNTTTPTRRRRMTPAIQQRLEAADASARASGRDVVTGVDLALACIDATPNRHGPDDHLIWYAQRRGLDTIELRRRLVVASAEPNVEPTFSTIPLPKRRLALRRARCPAWLELAPNPLGYDPWIRRGWGSVFAVTRDGRHLEVDGKHWFFYLDADGYFVRTTDGRPVGYRWWLVGEGEKARPRGGKLEVLPMPPVPVDYWPDWRYVPED